MKELAKKFPELPRTWKRVVSKVHPFPARGIRSLTSMPVTVPCVGDAPLSDPLDQEVKTARQNGGIVLFRTSKSDPASRSVGDVPPTDA